MKTYFKILIALLIYLGPYLTLGQNSLKKKDIQDTQKQESPQVAFLWMFHFASKENVIRQKFDDIKSEKSQKELIKLVNTLKDFAPTKIAIERPYYTQEELNKRYQLYLQGAYKLATEETDQIAFRLGKALGHKQLYVVYYPGTFEVDSVVKYANDHGQMYLYDSVVSIGERLRDIVDEKLENESIIEGLKYLNSKEAIDLSHLSYYPLIGIGDRADRVGADLVADWYEVNIKIFSNICDLIESKNDRILILYGQGHAKILGSLVNDAPNMDLVDISPYLND